MNDSPKSASDGESERSDLLAQIGNKLAAANDQLSSIGDLRTKNDEDLRQLLVLLDERAKREARRDSPPPGVSGPRAVPSPMNATSVSEVAFSSERDSGHSVLPGRRRDSIVTVFNEAGEYDSFLSAGDVS